MKNNVLLRLNKKESISGVLSITVDITSTINLKTPYTVNKHTALCKVCVCVKFLMCTDFEELSQK